MEGNQDQVKNKLEDGEKEDVNEKDQVRDTEKPPGSMSEPRGNVVFRQELANLTPECGFQCAFLCSAILLIIFVGFGVPIVMFRESMSEYIIDYTDCTTPICTKTLAINTRLIKPNYVYYEIHNFYSNHRDYVRSRDFGQLRGEYHISPANNSVCTGARYVSEMFDNNTSKYLSIGGKPLKADDYANPCGFAAKAFFTDSFQIMSPDGNRLLVNETDIANDYDKKYVFKQFVNSTDVQWLDVTNEHFIVWMQMESFPNFRKLWGRIDSVLNQGNYTLVINNNYNVKSFNGKKMFVLTSQNVLGTSSFFGYTLIIGGSFCITILILLLTMFIQNRNKKYDYISLKWK